MRRALFSFIIASALLAAAPSVWAAEPGNLTAEIDQTRITVDDTVSLKIGVQLDGTARVGTPEFSAPGLEVVNQFQSTYVESYYENGRFGMRNNRQMTFVLKPSKPGSYSISKISLQVNDAKLQAEDLKVEVLPGGSAAGNGAAPGVRSAKPAPRGEAGARNAPAFVRAELSKDTVYKGEQVVVSYYLYQRARIFNISVDKYPVLTGFLREDLEMPYLNQRLDPERVTIEGVPWERALLLQYAAYPLQEGKLKIDQLSIKFNIYGEPDNSMNEDDPFSAFFRQMAPRPGAARSEAVNVEVLPLPTGGKPASFTGAIGQFTLKASLDKTEVKANQPVTLTAQIQGRGNLSPVSELQATWPAGLELYDSKKQERTEKNGTTHKTFEFLLIPRQAGDLTVPSLELAVFDPAKKEYVTLKTEPFALKVLPGEPGTETAPAAAAPAARAARPDQPEALRPLKLRPGPDQGGGAIEIRGYPVWRWVYWLCVACFGVFLMYVAIEWMRRGRILSKKAARDEAKRKTRSWDGLKHTAKAAVAGSLAWPEVMRAYEDLAGALFDQLDERLPHAESGEPSSRSLSRRELRRLLVDGQGMPVEKWEPLEKALEVAETVRFTGSAGIISETDARAQLGPLIEGAQRALSK